MNSTKNMPLTLKSPHKKQLVTQHLRELAATLTPGARLPSVNELERTFGYATSTIEAALNELQREGLIIRRQGSGTFVADAAHSGNTNLPVRQTKLIILTANTRSVLYQVEMLQRLEAELQGGEFTPVLVFEENAERRFERIAQYGRDAGILGYIHVGSTEFVGETGIPGVIIGEVPEPCDASQVMVDSFRAGQRVGELLWGMGHRRVLYVAGNYYTQIGEGRLGGLRNTWELHGAAKDVFSLTSLTEEQIFNANLDHLPRTLEQLLNRPDAPTALFAVDDLVALEVLRVLHLLGRRVPEEISLVGFNDSGTVAAQVTPPLTTVRMPCAVLVSLAVQELRERLLNPDLPSRRFRIPAEITIRESAGPPPGAIVTPTATLTHAAVPTL